MKNKFDVIIVGGGAIGCATAFFISKLAPQLKVLLLEKSDDLGAGASGSWGSLLRVFSTLPQVSERAVSALPHFMRYSERVGEPLIFNKTGSLYFFRAFHRAQFQARFDFLSKIAQTGMEFLEFEEGRLRFPEFQWMPGDFAIYEALAGYVEPSSAVWGWVNAGIKRGLEMRTKSQVVEVLVDSLGNASGVKTSDGDVFEAKSFVMAAGPWLQDAFLSGKLEPLAVTRVPIQINRYRSSQPVKVLPFFIDSETCSFARFDGADILGGYVQEDVQSEEPSRQPMSLAASAEAKRRLSKRLKWLRTADTIGGVRAVETYTKDLLPLMGFSRKLKNVYIASGWCCAGFMLAPYYGEEIARQLIGLNNIRITGA